MAERVCSWWIGYILASPVRRWLVEDPETMLAPYIREGMTVLEPGPGMGFFTLPLANLVGASGRVIAIDIQSQMLDGLRRRAHKAGLLGRIETRLAQPDRMGLEGAKECCDFVLAFAVVHEMPSAVSFFGEAAAALKPGGILLFAEPAGHVSPEFFERELHAAQTAGLAEVSRPAIRKRV
jgi:ubiquinone/menaquinone biosynthesis C-methylase UbiE